MSAGLLAALLYVWSAIWPYLVTAVIVGLLAAIGWRLWRTDHSLKSKDRAWRHEDEVRAGHRTLNEVDRMSGTEFEDLVAQLCRRDGCSEVRRVGGAGDNGADVMGQLPDGRSMVIQCKRYAAARSIPARDLRDVAGSRYHFKADVAIFVTTSRFTNQSAEFALANNILAIHRDILGLWNKGTPLMNLFEINGSGQGDRAHQARWKNTYGGRPTRKSKPTPADG